VVELCGLHCTALSSTSTQSKKKKHSFACVMKQSKFITGRKWQAKFPIKKLPQNVPGVRPFSDSIDSSIASFP
jgi:hypothetical protein